MNTLSPSSPPSSPPPAPPGSPAGSVLAVAAGIAGAAAAGLLAAAVVATVQTRAATRGAVLRCFGLLEVPGGRFRPGTVAIIGPELRWYPIGLIPLPPLTMHQAVTQVRGQRPLAGTAEAVELRIDAPEGLHRLVLPASGAAAVTAWCEGNGHG
ncbi:hypothetical protein [Glycomyces sp. MUSA5-2]|uniref:hypothetical protein n=1 Tax=Glycomyces sp. MUSA5-2 TaxID=2053002 RepID=UPI0030089404